MKNIKAFAIKIFFHALARDSAIVFVGSTGANVGAYLYHLFIGRILGPQQYGELAALLSLFYILNVPSSVLQTILVKFFSALKAKKAYGRAKDLFLSMTGRVFLVEVALFVIVLWFFPYLANFLHIPSIWYFIWLYLIFALFLLGTVNASVLQAFQLFRTAMIFTNIGVALRLILGTLGALWGVGWTLFANVVSSALGYVLVFLPLGFILKHKREPVAFAQGQFVQYSIPTFLATLGIIMLYSQDVVLVKHFFGALEAGIYSSLSVLGKAIFFASAAVSYVIFPVIAERKEQQASYMAIVLLALFAVGAISFSLTAIYYLAPSFVVHLLFGKAYASAALLLGPFGLFLSFFTLSSLLASIFLALGKTFVWMFTIGAALLQTVLITAIHSSLYAVILINLGVCSLLFMVLALSYAYVHVKK